MSATPDPLSRLRALALALPRTVEKLAWGASTIRVDDRIFAMADTPEASTAPARSGPAGLSVWLAAPEGAQEMLIEAAPDRVFRPPYVGRKGWIGLRLERPGKAPPDGTSEWSPDWDEVAFNLARTHKLIAARRARSRR